MRLVGNIALASSTLLVGVAGLLPLLGLLLASRDSLDSLDPRHLGELFGPRTLGLLGKTAWISLVVAGLSTLLAVSLLSLLDRVRQPSRTVLLVLNLAPFFVSPFVFTQGWINLLGDGGRLRELAEVWCPGFLPPLQSIFGWSALSVIQFTPLALMLILLTRAPLSRRLRDDVRMFAMTRWEQLRTVWWLRHQRSLALSGVVVFLFCFWNWDIPSMLRQTSFALEVMSFFGSFYDYGKACLLAAPVLAITGGIALLLLFRFRGSSKHHREHSTAEPEAPDSPSHRAVPSLACLACLLLPLAGIGAPLASLAISASSWEKVREVWALFPSDVSTTLIVGPLTGLLAVTGASLAAGWRWTRLHPGFTFPLIQWIAVALPGILAGIGISRLFSDLPVLHPFSSSLVRLVLAQILVFLPLAHLALMGMGSFWKPSWREFAHLSGNRFLFFQAGLGAGWRPLLLLFLLIGSLSMREVPVALVNYPAGTSTLALSIETVLHFDQPQVVSVLCLLQLTTVTVFWMTGALVFVLIRWKTSLP